MTATNTTTEEIVEVNRRKGWCKIIETEKRDFLFQIMEDEEIAEVGYKLKLTTETNSCELTAYLSSSTGFTFEQVKELLDDTTAETLDKILASIFGDDFSLDAFDEVADEEE